MTVVMDTNVLVRLFGPHSPLAPLKKALLEGRLELAVSTPVLLEYEEVVCRYASRERWEEVARFLELLDMLRGTVRRVSPAFRFLTITGDPDDDAFADCAIAAGADYILTSDHHFDVLKAAGFKPQPITPEQFIQRFLQS